MDTRKIQFLIGMQREIDKLEAKDGNTPKIERVKSRFYDVLEVEEVAKGGQKVPTDSTDSIDESIQLLINQLKLSKPKSHRKHAPKEVIKFLKLFKFDNPTGSKELVHSPDDPQKFNYHETLRKSLKNCIEVFQENYMPDKLSDRIVLLYETLSLLGLKYWYTHKIHPLYNDNDVTKVIQEFKKNYRFDVETTEASVLRELIVNIAKKAVYSSNGLSIKFFDRFFEIQFKPDADFFDVNSIFFADVESFKIGLSVLFQSLIKHTNVDGNEQFDVSQKKLVIETTAHEMADGWEYKLMICDVGAITKKKPQVVLENLRGWKQEAVNQNPAYGIASRFLSVCDWSIRGVFAGEPHELIIQPFHKNTEMSILPLKDNSCTGFTHIFTFYDV